MRRTWLTSTTALALVLNAAAPMPGVALGATDVSRNDAAPQLMRLAQSEAEALQDDTATDAIEGAVDGAVDEAAQQAAQAEAEAEALAAENAANAAAQQAEDEAAAAQQQAADDAAAQQAAEAEAAATAEADAAAEAQAQADAAAAQQAADEAAAAEQQAIDQQAIDAAAAEAEQQADEADAAATAEAEADVEAATEEQATGEAAPEPESAPQAESTAEEQAAQDAATSDDVADPAVAEDAATAEPADQTATGEDDAPATDQAAEELPETGATDVGATETTVETTTDTAEAPEVSAEAQADALAEETGDAPAAAAASGEGEVVDSQEGTVTEDQARASDEEFETTAGGQQTVFTQAPTAKEKDNDLLKAVGIVAAAGLGAYAVGKMLNNGGEVVSNTGDRAVVRDPNGQYRIIKDDDTLLRQPGSNVATQTYTDGSTRTEVVARDNSSTVTIRAADGRVLRRTRILPDGQEVLLFDDTRNFDRVDVTNLRPARESDYDYSTADEEGLRAALSAKNEALPERTFSLNQIRRIDAVRKLVPVIALDAINFRTGSAVIEAGEAKSLSALGNAMLAAIDNDPAQVFLIEGHTDTVGDASYNLALSDRRAESVALALTEYFDVPPSNMIVQGYGEADLRIKQTGDIRGNRRGAVRNITPLLTGNR
ncbi:OmpA family protein [Roseovarius sp. M141]|uniref:OmpA family protein n=1 Tax=Roseovarius sp. M141 TaxID=2583806 RepID=UPI0020CC1308|nr:OmpA family protein [Roseovarius sp. M141]MCQ0093169.1 OmpA family protein [Roseovarius sp. M141]